MALYTNITKSLNYTTVGNVVINNSGEISGFSTSDYVRLPNITINDNYELGTKFIFKDEQHSSGTVGIIGTPYLYSTCGFKINPSNGISSSIRYLYNGSYTTVNSSIATTTMTIQPNTIYYAKAILKNNSYQVLISTDNINWIEGSIVSIPEGAEILSPKGQQGQGGALCIGGGTSQVLAFNGIVYLKSTYVKIDDEIVFGYDFSKVKLHSPTAIAYTKVGNPTITSDGVASGFTDKTDYLTLGAFNPGTSKWKFTTKVKIYDYATQISLIDRNSSTRCFQIVVRTTGKFRVNISTNGTSKANEVDGTHVLSVNTIYYICFEYDGNKYYLKYSLDNINWVTDITINNSTKIYPVSSMCMGHSWYNSGTEKWNGEIYLRYTRFEINGVTNDKYKLHALEGDYAIVDDKLVWANPNIYLQSSGTQRINTNFNANQDTQIKMKASTSNITTNQSFFVGRNAAKVNTFAAWVLKSGSTTIFRNDYNTTQSNTTLNIVANIIYNIDFNKNKFYVNNTLYTTTTYAAFQCTYPIIIGASTRYTATDTNYGNYLQGKIYNCQIYDNGTLVRHFVPVPTGMVIGDFTVPSNGMFDIVNQQFYPNQGTGTFTYGKDE